jgi:hypothetical protein
MAFLGFSTCGSFRIASGLIWFVAAGLERSANWLGTFMARIVPIYIKALFCASAARP